MNKKLKDTLKEHLRPHLPQTIEAFYSLHQNPLWIVHTINELLTEKIFFKILETRLLSELEKLLPLKIIQDNSLEEALDMLEPEPLLNILQEVCKKPLFIPSSPKPKAPAKWLDLAKELIHERDLIVKFSTKYGTWNLEQDAIKLRDLCKDNEEEIEKIAERLRNDS